MAISKAERNRRRLDQLSLETEAALVEARYALALKVKTLAQQAAPVGLDDRHASNLASAQAIEALLATFPLKNPNPMSALMPELVEAFKRMAPPTPPETVVKTNVSGFSEAGYLRDGETVCPDCGGIVGDGSGNSETIHYDGCSAR